MRSASFASTPHRSAARTGASDVPWALARMMDSSPAIGSLDPGAGGAPLQPADRPSGAADEPMAHDEGGEGADARMMSANSEQRRSVLTASGLAGAASQAGGKR